MNLKKFEGFDNKKDLETSVLQNLLELSKDEKKFDKAVVALYMNSSISMEVINSFYESIGRKSILEDDPFGEDADLPAPPRRSPTRFFDACHTTTTRTVGCGGGAGQEAAHRPRRRGRARGFGISCGGNQGGGC